MATCSGTGAVKAARAPSSIGNQVAEEVLLDEVHLVDDAEELGLGGEDDDGLETALVVVPCPSA